MTKTAGTNAKLQIGEIEIIGITDMMAPFPAHLTVDRVFPTVTAEEWNTIRDRYPDSFSAPDILLGRVSCYLIRRPGYTVLVDTGLGAANPLFPSAGVQGQLLEQLGREGIAPGDVDTVFLTHLHQDHVSWNVQRGEENNRPTFPQARYMVHQADWEMCERLLATNPAAAAYVRDQIVPLHEWGILSLLTGETMLADDMCAIHTPGHSPGHMSLQIESGRGDRLLILGDAFYHPLQVTEPAHHFGGDGDATVANTTRAQLLERIEAEDMIIAACHFPEPGFGRVTHDGQRRFWQPI